jgi:nitrogen fixation protein FixH
MKLNWGTGLLVSFLVFAAAILIMVSISMHREVDLVSDDYYQQELKHQDQIESAKRTNALTVQPAINVTGTVIELKLPGAFPPLSTSGTLTFYRPADRKRDFVLPLKLDSSGAQTIQGSALQKGLWRIKVSWRHQNQSYYHEEPIMLQ